MISNVDALENGNCPSVAKELLGVGWRISRGKRGGRTR